MFTKLDIKDDIHVIREFRFNATDFPAFTKELIDLGTQATAFASLLFEVARQ